MRRSANLWLPLLSILVAAIMTIANLEIQKRYSRFDDFAPRWTAARWWLRTGASPYSEETYAQTKLIQGDYGLAPNGFDNGHFVEPAFYIYFFLPLSFIEFIVARAFWMRVLEFSVMVTVCRSTWWGSKPVRKVDLISAGVNLSTSGESYSERKRASFIHDVPNLGMSVGAQTTRYRRWHFIAAVPWLGPRKFARSHLFDGLACFKTRQLFFESLSYRAGIPDRGDMDTIPGLGRRMVWQFGAPAP